MSDTSNLPNSKKIVLKTRPDGNPKESDFEIIEEVAKAPDDDEVLIEVQALGIGAWTVSYTHLTLPTKRIV